MTNRSWFTLIEITVVIAMLALVLAAILPPFAAVSGRASIRSQLVSESLLWDVQRQLLDSTSGYSSVSASEGVRNDRLALPQDFVAYFRSENSWTDFSSTYLLLETQTRKQGNSKYTRIISRDQKEYGGERTYLKQIVLKKSEADTWVAVSSLAISYKNPTGNCAFYYNTTNFAGNGNVVIPEDSSRTIHEFPEMASDPDYQIAELHFYDTFEKELFVAKIHKDKQFYATLPELNP